MMEFSFGEVLCLVAILTSTSSKEGSISGACYCTEVFFLHIRLFCSTMVPLFLFMDDNATSHRTVVVAEQLESEDIRRIDCPIRSPDLNPTEDVWDILGRCLTPRC